MFLTDNDFSIQVMKASGPEYLKTMLKPYPLSIL